MILTEEKREKINELTNEVLSTLWGSVEENEWDIALQAAESSLMSSYQATLQQVVPEGVERFKDTARERMAMITDRICSFQPKD